MEPEVLFKHTFAARGGGVENPCLMVWGCYLVNKTTSEMFRMFIEHWYIGIMLMQEQSFFGKMLMHKQSTASECVLENLAFTTAC